MFDDGSFPETGQFSVIHKIVLGVLPLKDLEAKLQAPMSAINDVDVGGRSAISWAAERADTSAVQLLLSYGAEHASPNSSGAHPLNYTAIAKDPAAMHTLLGHGVEGDSCNAYGHTLLKSASQTQDNERFLQLLLSAGAEIDARDYEGETALIYVACSEKVEIAAYLLASGADMYAHTIWGLTALDLCIRYNCHQMLRFLLQQEADHWSQDIHGKTILHPAASDGDTRTIAMLIDMGVSGVAVGQEDSLEKTAWDYLHGRAGVEMHFSD
jgi:ankyrin repeat protein